MALLSLRQEEEVAVGGEVAEAVEDQGLVDAAHVEGAHHALDDALGLRDLDALLEGLAVQLEVEGSSGICVIYK